MNEKWIIESSDGTRYGGVYSSKTQAETEGLPEVVLRLEESKATVPTLLVKQILES